MSQQLIDNGAVIGYRPTLEYVKSMNNANASVSGTIATDASGTVKYSSTVTGLVNNLPSAAIGDVDYVIDNIKKLIDELGSKFQAGNWGEYNSITTLLNAVAINDTEYIDKFIGAHKHNITGSIVPELIGHLYSTEKRLVTLNNVLKELYYGTKDVTQEEMDAKDASNVAKMQALEAAGDGHKINYVTISYDSTLSRAVSTKVFAINKQAIGMSRILNKATHLTDDAAYKELVSQLYSEVNADLDYRQESFEIQQTVEIMRKTLYNYYNSRNDYMNLYHIYNGQEFFSMMHRLDEYKYRLDRSLENVIRALEGNQYYLSQMTALEQEKANLMSNYAKLNYKY